MRSIGLCTALFLLPGYWVFLYYQLPKAQGR